MAVPTPTDEADTAEYIAFEEFRDGLRFGRFRVIVNPGLAPAFVAHRVLLTPLTIAVLGVGVAVALAGYPVIGLALVATGMLLRRVVKRQASAILLHLASQHADTYDAATTHGVMEVRRA